VSPEQDEHDDALAEAGAAAARLGVELARFQNALDRLGRATTALRAARDHGVASRP
jgi:flagellin-like hook-associated protein FlgL